MIYIKSLHIENYKCYEYVDVEFNNLTNIIVGNNEAGKSTILEAKEEEILNELNITRE